MTYWKDEMFYSAYEQNQLGSLGTKTTAAAIHILPVPRRGTQFGVVLDFGLCPAGPHGGHASIRKGKGDHLAAFTSRENLGTDYTRSECI